MSSRSERPSKKPRRLSTDSEGTEDAYDWVGLKKGRAEKATAGKNEPLRTRRTASENAATATVSRGPPSSASSKSPQSIRLTVKTSSSKLREATRTSSSGRSAPSTSRDGFVGGEILEGKRARNVRKSYVLESDSDEEEDEEMEDVADEDAEGESVEDEDEEEEEEEDMDAEDDGLGDEDADGEIDMDLAPPPPVIKISKTQTGKQTIITKPPSKVDHMSVEQKEMQEASDDEELSELDSDLGDEVEEEEAMQTGNEEDAEGEEEEIEVEEVEDDEEEDSDDETPAGGSRASTPDLNKLTKRQRARLEEGGSGHLLALPDEVQVKKHLTAEEHAMRRAEMARRRKNLSEKRNEEEKMETINKLLKKQAPKTNARRRDLNAVPGETNSDSETQKANPLFVRWISNKDGNRIVVPEEWLDGPAGDLFMKSVKPSDMGSKLIEEVS